MAMKPLRKTLDHPLIQRLRALHAPWDFVAGLYDTTSNSVRSAHYRWVARQRR
jgi:hypothetical protein